MSKLKELERRLRDEPDNLGLRVTVAGALLEVGRRDEGIELYRSVASAYRDQGRAQQAIAVCRAILEVAPDDARCQALLVQLEPKSATRVITAVQDMPSIADSTLQPELPTRRSTIEDLGSRAPREDTPLPGALPYHVADPTTHSIQKLSAADLAAAGVSRPTLEAIARDSLFDIAVTSVQPEPAAPTLIADEVDITKPLATRQVPRIAASDLDKIDKPPPPTDGDTEDEPTDPRAMPLAQPTPLPSALTRAIGPTLPPAAPGRLPAGDTARRASAIPTARPRSISEQLPLRAPDAVDDTRPTDRDLPRAPRPAARTQPPPPPRTGEPTPSPRPRSTSQSSGLLASAFFAALPLDQRATVFARFQHRALPAGSTVIRQGEVAHPLFVVARGRLDVAHERADGSRISLGTIPSGAYAGEDSLLSRGPAPAHVIAAMDVELMELSPRDFHAIASAHPALWSALTATAAERTRARTEALSR